MLTNNIKLERDRFVSIFYDLYHRLHNNDLFKLGYEDCNFKIWQHDTIHYLLVKSNGLLIQWDEILSYRLCANKKLTEGLWLDICSQLEFALDNAKLDKIDKSVYDLE